MKVQITDWNSQIYEIRSRRPGIIAEWFEETCARVATNIPALMSGVRIMIYPEDSQELDMLEDLAGKPLQYASTDLVKLYLAIKKQAEICLEREMRDA